MKTDKIREILSDNQAALILSEKNRKYFTQFDSSDGFLLITPKKSFLFLDFRYFEAGSKNAENCNVVLLGNFFEQISDMLREKSQVFIETDFMSVKQFELYSDKLSQKGITLLKDNLVTNTIRDLRSVKTEDELQKINKAQIITEKSFNEVLNYIKPGVSEREISLELEYLMKKNGAQKTSFDLITITGKKTSLPHGVPGDEVIKSGDFFTMDIGAVYDGYSSDMTRTVAVGKVSEKQQEIYDTVLKAQLSALRCVKSGVKCSDVDKSARDVISSAGYSKCFGHATGHGVGLDIHEHPVVGPKSDTILQNNMVITVEPGIYLPGEFGVRIEDMVYVTQNGYENFTKIKKELIIL